MEKWTEKIDQITRTFDNTFGKLNAEQLNWKPDEETWSIGQNVDHIIRLNRSYFPTFEKVKQGNYKAPFIAKFGFFTSLLGNLLKSYNGADRKKKIKTFDIWEPGEGGYTENILAEFKSHQLEMKKQIEELQPFINGQNVISSPASRYLVYKLEDALDIITQHEERHYNQAKEVLESMQF